MLKGGMVDFREKEGQGWGGSFCTIITNAISKQMSYRVNGISAIPYYSDQCNKAGAI
jgi:hypothetical protein